MSWDVFVQDLPPGIESVADIPADFSPSPIGLRGNEDDPNFNNQHIEITWPGAAERNSWV